MRVALRPTILFLISTIVGVVSFSCKKDDTSGVPAYVKIDSISVRTDYQTQGSGSSNLSDAWFYANDEFLGVFELPTEIPVLENGNTNLKTFGGIKVSGVSSWRKSYPFYRTHEIETVLVKENTISIHPIVSYNDNTTFAWMEDFDDLAVSMDTTATSTVPFIRMYNSDSVKEGKASMAAFMDRENNYFMAYGTQPVALPGSDKEVYMEVDYMSNTKLQFYIKTKSTVSGENLIPMVVANPRYDENGKPVWNKLYIFLTPYVSADATNYEFEFFFESFITSTQSSGFVMMDNIKVVY